MAVRWESEGAERLHVVDLDGAFEKEPRNLEAIRRIVDKVKIPIQLGGGIRTMEAAGMYLGLGVSYVIFGTRAVENPEIVRDACSRYPGRIMVGIDARDGMVATEGWTETTKQRAVDVAMGFEGCGLAGIVFTDIHRDGMERGTNVEATGQLAEAVSIPIIASGGVSGLQDIRQILPLESKGVAGIITGRALYSGTLDLREAIQLAAKGRDIS
jgi:phosphoribosylformimino-5-aminoimidazole carboxamide ribotide isomerase